MSGSGTAYCEHPQLLVGLPLFSSVCLNTRFQVFSSVFLYPIRYLFKNGVRYASYVRLFCVCGRGKPFQDMTSIKKKVYI